MYNIIDNRTNEDYRPQIRDLSLGEFFEYDNHLFMKTYEGSPTSFECFDFAIKRTLAFSGDEEVERVVEKVKIILEDN
jgi:hypothetical protein